MDTMLNIFTGDAFSNITLTTLANQNFPYVPGFLTDLNLAPGTGITTLDAAFEDVNAGIRMISTTPRGAPPSEIEHVKGRMRKLTAQHLAREVTVIADELLGARARGTMNPQTLQNLVLERVDGPVGVKMQLNLTWEHWLLGLVQGKVYDADGTTLLYDYFDWTGTAVPAPVVLSFSTMTTDTGLLTALVLKLRRQMINALNGMAAGAGRLIILCGDNFFDALATCKEVVAARKVGAFGSTDASAIISRVNAYSAIDFAGALWVNYRGTISGDVQVPMDEARAFMAGVPGLFQTLYAPADTFDFVSAIGLPYYLLNDPNDKNTDKRAVLELQSNPLPVNLRPGASLVISKS